LFVGFSWFRLAFLSGAVWQLCIVWRYNNLFKWDCPYLAIFKFKFAKNIGALLIFQTGSPLTKRYKVLPVLGALRVIVTKTVGGFLFVKGLAKNRDVIFCAS
jgi:hypothetical protein